MVAVGGKAKARSGGGRFGGGGGSVVVRGGRLGVGGVAKVDGVVRCGCAGELRLASVGGALVGGGGAPHCGVSGGNKVSARGRGGEVPHIRAKCGPTLCLGQCWPNFVESKCQIGVEPVHELILCQFRQNLEPNWGRPLAGGGVDPVPIWVSEIAGFLGAENRKSLGSTSPRLPFQKSIFRVFTVFWGRPQGRAGRGWCGVDPDVWPIFRGQNLLDSGARAGPDI